MTDQNLYIFWLTLWMMPGFPSTKDEEILWQKTDKQVRDLIQGSVLGSKSYDEQKKTVIREMHIMDI